ncbi:MAG: hypothetical protein Q9187_006512 [Circinaria calcarea]
MVNSSQAPADLKPSIQQWKALLKAFAGILSSTSFPNRVRFYVDLYSASSQLRPWESRQSSSHDAESIAEALLALGRVSRGELASITIIGLADAGCLAAIGEWVFGLSINVTNRQGSVLHSNIGEEEDRNREFPQLLIIFDDGVRDPAFNHTNSSIHTTGKTFVLMNAIELVPRQALIECTVFTGGRVPWDTILSSAFGADLVLLLKMPRALGCAIGNAARIFKAVALFEEGVPFLYTQQNRTYGSASYGRGFIQNVIRWFPELASLKGYMDEGIRKSFAHAKTMYETNLLAIRSACNCPLCRGFENDPDKYQYCYPAIVDTIISLARCLSDVTVPNGLYPTLSGIELFYQEQYEKRWTKDDTDFEINDLDFKEFEKMDPVLYSFYADENYERWDRYNAGAGARLFRALRLFSGCNIQIKGPQSEIVSALCAGGLCAYLDVLRELSDSKESTGRINIVQGRIELDSKAYDFLEDYPRRPWSNDNRPDLPAIFSATYQYPLVIVKEKAENWKYALSFGD